MNSRDCRSGVTRVVADLGDAVVGGGGALDCLYDVRRGAETDWTRSSYAAAVVDDYQGDADFGDAIGQPDVTRFATGITKEIDLAAVGRRNRS